MTKQEIIDYVMTTPSNPNKAVLEGMLDGVGGADVPTPTIEDAGKVLGVNENGKYSFNNVDCGFSCTEEYTVLTDETVTTEEDDSFAAITLSYATPITADTIIVTFDGTEYECNKQTHEPAPGVTLVYYGATISGDSPDFSEYPFNITSEERSGNMIATPAAGSHTVKIEAPNEEITTTECFVKAVDSILTQEKVGEVETVRYYKENPYSQTVLCDHTYAQVLQLIKGNAPVKFGYSSTGIDGAYEGLVPTGDVTFFGVDGFTTSPFKAVSFVSISHNTDNSININTLEIKSAS